MAKRIEIAPEKLAYARYQYEETSTPNADIAAGLGINVRTLDRRIPELGWRRRREQSAKISPPAQSAIGDPVAAAAPPALVPDATRKDVALRIQETIERKLAAIENIVTGLSAAPQRAGEAERTARTLASLARTLRELTQMRSADTSLREGADDDPVPRNIDEFRRELARRIDALIASPADGRVCGEPERRLE